MDGRHRWLAALAGVGLALGMTATAAAYGHQVPQTITVTPSSAIFTCDQPASVSATVLDQDGLPLAGETVTWSITTSPSADDQIFEVTTTTNTDGVAETDIQVACVPGDRTITATAGDVSGSAVVAVEGGGVLGATSRPTLPPTSTSPLEPVPGGMPSPLVPLGFAVVIAAALILRRSASRR